MATNTKQSALERIGIEERHENFEAEGSVLYNYNEGKNYEDVIENNPQKGTQKRLRDVRKTNSAPNTAYDYDSVDARNGGSKVDKESRKEQLLKNEYSAENPYGVDSVQISSGIKNQFITKEPLR